MVQRWRENSRRWCVVSGLLPAWALVAPVVAALPPPPPGVQTIERYGMDFSVVGAPGNAPFAGGPFGNNAGTGDIDHAYAIGRTQITNGQWVEFANSYRPFITGNPDFAGIAEGLFIRYDAGQDRYITRPGSEQFAANVSWRMAARYCNWLHNDKRLDAAAFATGAYDTTTFTADGVFPFGDALDPMPGARVRLPLIDEWIKAAYFDPQRHGQDQPGYWLFPNRTDSVLPPGLPGTSGQTTAGLSTVGLPFFSWYLPVAAYPTVQSPWGLFDLSGSGRDWGSEATIDLSSRFTFGSQRLDLVPEFSDSLEWFPIGASFASDVFPSAGVRLIFVIPAPSAALLACIAPTIFAPRRRS